MVQFREIRFHGDLCYDVHVCLWTDGVILKTNKSAVQLIVCRSVIIIQYTVRTDIYIDIPNI